MPNLHSVTDALDHAVGWKLATTCERAAVAGLFEPSHPFAGQLEAANSLHIHIKVDDTDALPRDEMFSLGAQLDHEKEGFVKFLFPGNVNLIFSAIPVSEDELAETECARAARPFVDHVGIDLRDETLAVQDLFNQIPDTAERAGWDSVSQGDEQRGVHCCHVEVKAKHWVYPRPCSGPAIPLEFAYGELKMNPVSGGCDLRPMDPQKAAATGGPPKCSAE